MKMLKEFATCIIHTAYQSARIVFCFDFSLKSNPD